MNIEEQLEMYYGLHNVECEWLNTPVNDVVVVSTPSSKFALKLYNISSRTPPDVKWEVDLVRHLAENGVPVVKPVSGPYGFVGTFVINRQERAAVLFEWALGEKPKAAHDTYFLLGNAAALIHNAADSFHNTLTREKYDAEVLIDDQLSRMESHLFEAGCYWQLSDLCDRLRRLLANDKLDYGICHMDLTFDNVHQDGDHLAVFDFDSAGECWRAIEPAGVMRYSLEYLQDWLAGYRTHRHFSDEDERAIGAFGIINDLRGTVWKLGKARSSRGKPLLTSSDLPAIIRKWLDWEKLHILN